MKSWLEMGGIGQEFEPELAGTDWNWEQKILGSHSIPPKVNSQTFRPIPDGMELTTMV